MTNKQKDKMLTSKFSDLKVIILENGFITLKTDYGDRITLGNYPNARFKLLEEMFEIINKIQEKGRDDSR